MTFLVIFGILVNGAIFLELSKKLVAYFYGLYLENVKTQMYDILNILVSFGDLFLYKPDLYCWFAV